MGTILSSEDVQSYGARLWNGWTSAGLALGLGIVFTKLRFRGGVCRSAAKLSGKTVLVTGANTGIGKETALDLARREARVILACRNVEKGHAAAADIFRETKAGEVVVMKLDLASLASVNTFCDEIIQKESHVDILINNAGVFLTPFTTTEDGHELQFGVNHLGHFLLTNRLLDLLKKSYPSRIVIVSSGLHNRGKIDFSKLSVGQEEYDKKKAYANSKLANVLFGQELSRRLEGSGVSVYTLHPGIVDTELARYLGYSQTFWMLTAPLRWLFLKSPWYGAQTTIYCAVAEELDNVSGKYYGDCEEQPFPKVEGADSAVARKLWEASERMTGLA